jgi:hypothetical protein
MTALAVGSLVPEAKAQSITGAQFEEIDRQTRSVEAR